MLGERRDADRDRGQRLRPIEGLDRLAEPLGSACGGIGVAAHDDGELVAADAEDLLAGARLRIEDAGEGDEHAVAEGVSLRVVDLLELVEIDEHEGNGRLPARGLLDERLEMLVEGTPVAQVVSGSLLASAWLSASLRLLERSPAAMSASAPTRSSSRSNWTLAGMTMSSTPRRSPSASRGTAVAAPHGTPYVR